MAASLKEAIQKAKLDPDNPKSQQLLKYLSDGKFDSQAAAEGIDLTKFKTNLQAKTNPIQQSVTDQRSVAAKEGWMDKLKTYVQENGQPVAPQAPKPEFKPLKTDNPSSGAQAMINRAQNEEEEGPGFFGRIKDTVVKTGEAIWEGAGDAQEGGEMIRASENDKGIAEVYAKKTQKEFDEGKIDKATYERKMNKSREIAQKGAELAGEGFSKQVAGGARVFGSPAEGLITGGLGPETDKVMNWAAEKIGDNEKASQFVAGLGKLAEEHPTMANYLTALAEVAGVKGGSKVLKNVGEGAIDATKKAVPVITDTVRRAGDTPMVTNAIQKLQDIGTTAGQKFEKTFGPDMVPEEFVDPKNMKRAMELMTPELNVKNFREAANQGLAVRESNNFWRASSPDKIELSNRLAAAGKTLMEKFPTLSKLKDVELPVKIKEEIGKIANEIRPHFKEINVSKEIKTKISDTWEKVKRAQEKNPDFSFAGVNSMQKNFETEILPKLTQKFQDAKGKFRNVNLEDVWDLVKGYDKSVPDRVKNAVETASDSRLLVQKDAWLQNREILRDTIDSLAETMKDLNAKKAFKQMSDLYEAQEVILKNLKPQKGKDGAFKAAAKEVIKASALPGATIAGAYAISK